MIEFAGIDLGASSGRVLAGRLQGTGAERRLSLEELHRFPHGPVPVPYRDGFTYRWDVIGLWEQILLGLRRAAAQRSGIASVAVDTWGVDFGLLDRRGALLASPVSYRDSRFAGMIERAYARVGRDELFRRTGLQFMPFNSLFQLMALREHEPHLLEQAERLVFLPDLLNYWLAEAEPAAEYTIASTSQMLAVESRQWDDELLRGLELPRSLLPPVVEPGTELGPARSMVLSETGLPSGVRIRCTAGHDTAAAVVATPGEGGDWAFLSAGTWCLFGAEVRHARLDPMVLESGFGNEGGVNGAYRLLRNITGLWLVQECRRYWEGRGERWSWDELAAQAAAAPPFAAVIDPDDPCFASPGPMPEIIARYCRATGQTPPDGAGACVRVCIEAIALAVARRWRQLEQILGRPLNVLNMVGGGIRNKLLCRTLADVLQKPVVAGPVEATAAGNILAQAVGMGELDWREARAVVRRSWDLTEYHPHPCASSEAEARFAALPPDALSPGSG